MFLNYLEPNGTMDGKSLGYVNIQSRSGPVTWGDMQVAETGDLKLSVTDISKDVAAVVFTYTLKNTDSKETYDVREAIRVRYTASRTCLITEKIRKKMSLDSFPRDSCGATILGRTG